ncbi:MAG: hypothetical protein NTY48_02430 [Candidatus Diapherotrites archaeon]|nr:hypothetical protein [Candidatus Diapherotrites archaeon]
MDNKDKIIKAQPVQMHPVECEKASNGLDSPAKTGGCIALAGNKMPGMGATIGQHIFYTTSNFYVLG